MKIKIISRSEEAFTKERNQDLQVDHFRAFFLQQFDLGWCKGLGLGVVFVTHFMNELELCRKCSGTWIRASTRRRGRMSMFGR